MIIKNSTILQDPSCRPDPSKMLKFLNGKEANERDFTKQSTVLACGNLFPSSNIVYGFSSDEEFMNWADGLHFADSIHRANRFIERAKKLEKETPAAVVAKLNDFANNTNNQLKSSAENSKMATDSLDFYLNAEGLTGHALEPKILNSAILFEHLNCTGDFRTFGSSPNLAWNNFTNTATSGRFRGVGVLCDGIFWTGKKMWIAAYPYFQLNDFRPFGMNDSVSSVLWAG